MSPAPGSVRVRVERLVLEGFSPAEQGAVAEAIRGALATRIQAGLPFDAAHVGVSGRPSPLTRIDAGAVPAEPGAIGRAVASAVPAPNPRPPGRPGPGRR